MPESLLNRVKFRVKPTPPFRLDFTVWALRRVQGNLIDRWDGKTYRRTLVHGGEPIEIEVAQSGSPGEPWLEVAANGDFAEHDMKSAITPALERLLGIRVDLTGFYRLAGGEARLDGLVERFRGVKPPRFATVFEALVNAIACQQVSLTVGISLLNRLADSYGESFAGGNARSFPELASLAGLDIADLRRLGLSRQKARAIIELAVAATSVFSLEEMGTMSNDDALALLQQLRGVGRWTAEYTLLRGLGRLDVFPGDDVGARDKLRRWLGLSEKLDYESVKGLLGAWTPYAGMLYFHLLLNSLAEAGYIT